MSDERPLICGFLKVRNEIIREGNLYRVLENMDHYCDAAVVCDDASNDGTREHLIRWVGEKQARGIARHWWYIGVAPDDQDFRKELQWKQTMLEIVHTIEPYFVLWMDGDEVFDAQGTVHLRSFCESIKKSPGKAWRFHYTQFWGSTTEWARTDGGFDDGYFIKLWKWSRDLSFDTGEGTHRAQFPIQIARVLDVGLVHAGPFEQLHYGNYGTNLRWKVIQYRGGLGGWERHLVFPNATFRYVLQHLIPKHCEHVNSDIAVSDPPRPFNPEHEARIRDLYNLKQREDYFTVIIPAYNRAADLPRGLESLLKQTYEKWIAIVLDDGSTDETRAVMREWQDRDPRIFYCRYPMNRGGVAMNEIGMALACEMTEWWTRLGSDDFFGPRKLEYDATALRVHDAVYGSYHVHRNGRLDEICNSPVPIPLAKNALLTSAFACSWANCAVRTSVLRKIREVYGNFCDPALRNMEDFLVNARIARESTGWAWRGVVDEKFLLNPAPLVCAEIAARQKKREAFEFEAAWNCVDSGASGNVIQTTNDENLTRQLIMQENIKRGQH